MWFSQTPVPKHVPSPEQPRTLVLYKYDTCPYCQRVLQKLPEWKLDVTLKDTMRDPQARMTLEDATGSTQVPCLFIDDVPLLESLEIVAWLDAYAKAGHR